VEIAGDDVPGVDLEEDSAWPEIVLSRLHLLSPEGFEEFSRAGNSHHARTIQWPCEKGGQLGDSTY
jgi:hypothetical protein